MIEVEPVAQPRRWRRRALRYGAPTLVAFLVATIGAFWFLAPDGRTAPMHAMPALEVPEVAPPAIIATTAVEELEVLAEPRDDAETVTTLSDTTEYGLPRTLLVLDEDEDGAWLQTLLPIRPNGSTGWVRASDVTLSTTSYRMEVSLSERTITLYDGMTKILHEGAAIGTEATPTPPGTYYVTDPVDLQNNPGTGYGAYALGISGFSDVLLSFAGGPGQLAVHGTTNPADLGEAVSNGCVRVPDDVILQIAELVPLGTPVIVHA